MLSTCQDDSEEPMPEVKLDRLNKDKQRLLASQSSAVTATSEALHFESLVDFFFKSTKLLCQICSCEKNNEIDFPQA